MFESVFDLPTHVLAVHLPVVLIPVLGIATVVVALREDWRRRYAVALLVATAVALGSVFVAMRTGEEFDSLLEGQVNVDDHESYAQTTLWYVVAWFVTMAGLVVAMRRGALRQVILGATVLAVVLASMSTYWVVRTGHEGARVTWEGVVPDDE